MLQVWPAVVQTMCSAIFGVIKSEEQNSRSERKSITLGIKEKVASLERLVLLLLTGSPRQIPVAAWKATQTVKSISTLGFPYFDPAVLNLETGHIVPHRYAPDTANATFAHTAAIGYANSLASRLFCSSAHKRFRTHSRFHFGPSVGTAALVQARLELQLLKLSGGQLVNQNPMAPRALRPEAFRVRPVLILSLH